MRRNALTWPQAWRRYRGPYFTADDMPGLAGVVKLELQRDDAAAADILDEAARRFLADYDMDRKRQPPGEVAAKAGEIERAARALLRALGLPPNATSARASGRTLADLAWWHASIAPPRRPAAHSLSQRWRVRSRARSKPRIERAVAGVIELRRFGAQLVEMHEGRRGKRHPQPGLDSFVRLMAGAYQELTGQSPYPSRRKWMTDTGDYSTGGYAGPFTRFLKTAASMLADRIKTEDSGAAAALTEWSEGDTLPQKADRLKVWKR